MKAIKFLVLLFVSVCTLSCNNTQQPSSTNEPVVNEPNGYVIVKYVNETTWDALLQINGQLILWGEPKEIDEYDLYERWATLELGNIEDQIIGKRCTVRVEWSDSSSSEYHESSLFYTFQKGRKYTITAKKDFTISIKNDL